MNRLIIAATGLLAPLALFASPAHAQAARNYDCTKAGNANKSVCKAAAAAKPAPKPVATRNYDCSKAGNANKAVCKGAAAPAAPSAPVTTARHYDCTKAGNANKAVCKGASTPSQMAPAPRAAPRSAPAPQMAPAPATRPSVTGQNTRPSGPNGTTARCRDGTMSMSAHRSGTCSRHGGVAQWY